MEPCFRASRSSAIWSQLASKLRARRSLFSSSSLISAKIFEFFFGKTKSNWYSYKRGFKITYIPKYLASYHIFSKPTSSSCSWRRHQPSPTIPIHSLHPSGADDRNHGGHGPFHPSTCSRCPCAPCADRATLFRPFRLI